MLNGPHPLGTPAALSGGQGAVRPAHTLSAPIGRGGVQDDGVSGAEGSGGAQGRPSSSVCKKSKRTLPRE